jgi:hypothetical protein
MINPPFMPISFAPGPPTTPVMETGPTKFVAYNGQSQQSKINTASPAPPMESGPGFAPGSPNTPTIGVGNIVLNPQGWPPAQTRMFIQGGQLYILDNESGTAYVVPASAQIPQPSIYNPTSSF